MINSFFLSLIKPTEIQKLKLQGGVVPAPLVAEVRSFFDLFHDSDKQALASRGYCYLKPIKVNAQNSIEVEKYYRFEATPKGSNEPITYYGLGAYFIYRAIFNNEFDIDSGFQYDDEEIFYEDIGFDTLFHNKSVFLLGDTPSDDMEVSWQEVGISMRRRAFN